MPVSPSSPSPPPASHPPPLLRARRAARLAAFATAIACAGWAALDWVWPPEPRHQGRPLSHWLAELTPGTTDGRIPAEIAVRAFGTNALPAILRELRHQDPQWKTALAEWSNQLPGRRCWIRTETHRRDAAVAALRALGPAAAPALPELIGLLSRTNLGLHAAEAVHAVGPAAIPSLDDLRHHADPQVRAQAARILSWLAADSTAAFAPLTNALGDPHWLVRYHAVRGLAAPGQPSARSLLIARLSDPVREVRTVASRALGDRVTTEPLSTP